MARGLPNWRMSAPAMKLRPAPIITIAFTPASTSPFSSASTMPSRTPGPNALTGGLSMVMTPTPSSTSNRTSSFSPSAMAFPPACPAPALPAAASQLLSQHCRFPRPAATQKRSRSAEARFYLEGENVKRAMPSGVFKTADGWLQLLVIRDDSWVHFCAVIGRPELATDQRFVDGDARALNEAKLMAIVRLVIATKPTAYWAATSAPPVSRHSTCFPSSDFRSSAIERLPRLVGIE